MTKTSKCVLVFAFTLMLLFSGRAVMFSGVVYAAGEQGYLQAGIADFEDESYEEALDNLLKAYEEDPSVAAAYYLGLTHKEIKSYDEARKYLEEAVTKDPALVDAYAMLGEVLYSLRLYPEAAAALTKASEQGVKPAYIAYLKGLVSLKSGKPDDAIARFKRAGELDRSYSQKAAYSTGLAYLKKGKREDARRSFEEAVAMDPESTISVRAERAIERLDKRGSGARPIRLTFGYSFLYDDNVLLKPSEDISGVDISGEGDFGHVLTFRAAYDSRSNDALSLRASYSFYQSLYQDLDELNIQVNSIAVAPYLVTGKGEVSLRAGYDYILLDTDGYLQAASIRPSYTHNIGDAGRLVFSIGVSNKGFLKAPVNRDEDRDALNINAGVTYFMFYGDKRGYLSFGYAFDSEEADGINWNYTGNKGTARLRHPFTQRLGLLVAARYYRQDYGNTHTVYGKKRADDVYTVAPELIYRLKSTSFNFRYSYTESDSNITVYDYSKNAYGVSIDYYY